MPYPYRAKEPNTEPEMYLGTSAFTGYRAPGDENLLEKNTAHEVTIHSHDTNVFDATRPLPKGDIFDDDVRHSGVTGMILPPTAVKPDYDRAQHFYRRGQQMPLFNYEPARLHTLYASEDARHLVPHTIGALVNISREQFGMTPHASTNLSPFSRRIVDKFGAAVPNAGEESEVNRTSRLDGRDNADTAISMALDTDKKADPEVLKAGKRVVMDTLRANRVKPTEPARSSNQQHPTLPGM